MRRLGLLALLVLTLAGPRPAAAEDDFARLAALDDAEHAGHDEAVAWWEERSEAQRIALLRRTLASNQAETARLAAHAIGSTWLSSHEIGRMVGLRLGDETRGYHDTTDWGLDGEPPLGAPLLVAYVARALREPDDFPELAISTAHRVTKPEHAQALLPLLERASPERLRQVLFLVTIAGEHDRADRHRRSIALATYYGLMRIRAQRAGKPAHKLTDLPNHLRADATAAPTGGGLPPVAIAIAEACDGVAPNGFARKPYEQDAMEARADPGSWVRRWLLDCEPGAGDLPFLRNVVELGLATTERRPYPPAHVHWAMGHLARMPGADGEEAVRAWAGQRVDMERAWHAAVALAARGDRQAFAALRAAADAGGIPEKDVPEPDPSWHVDRAEARARAVARLRTIEPESIGSRHELTPESRYALARDDGLRIGSADLDAIAEGLWAHVAEDGHTGMLRLARYHAYVHPGALTTPRARQLLAGLRSWLAREDTSAAPAYEPMDEDALDRVLALCEVRDPDGTRALLDWWASGERAGRDYALERLARLGAQGHAEALIARWSDEEADWRERWLLGLVPGDAVTAFLRAKAPREGETLEGGRVVESLDALHALLLHAGLPRTIAPLFGGLAWVEGDDPAVGRGIRAAWQAALAGDAIGALLPLADIAGSGVHALGAVDDPRTVRWLEDRRRDRDRGLYWEATMGRAGHDPAAALDVLALIRAGRTWLLEHHLQGGGLGHLPREVLLHELTAALDSNCCLGWAAHVLLREVHPWLPFDDGFGGAGTEVTRAFLAEHAWRHSEIFGGPVPAPR